MSGGFDLRALRRDYGDVAGEAASCRAAAALFDFSFMSRICIRGDDAQAVAQSLTPRPLHDLAPGRIRYALRVDVDGRVLGDLTIWCIDAQTFEVFDGTGEALAQLPRPSERRAVVEDLSSETAVFAVQGPASLRALSAGCEGSPLRALRYFQHAELAIGGIACRVGRLGYTGERGFEIVLPGASRHAIWTRLAQHARPAGFAAADILRIEAGFLLFANELRFPVSATELGLSRFAPGTSISPVEGRPGAKPRVRLVCFEASRDTDPVLWGPRGVANFPPAPGELVATSACRSIVTKAALGLGYAADVSSSHRLVDPTGEFRDVREVPVPCYDPYKRKPRGGWRDDLWPETGETSRSHSFGR